MKKLSLVEKITQGTEEAEKKKLATDETTEGNAPGDDSGDPLYNIPTKKTDEQMNQDPKEVLNADVASEMGAADTIESLIKKVVTEAIKEAATPEGHVDPSAMKDMGAPKMSAAKLARYKGVSYEIESKGSSPNTKYYGVCEELDIKTGPMISPSDAGYEIRILIDESIKDRDTKMSRMAEPTISESMIDNVDNSIDKLKSALEGLDHTLGFFRSWLLKDDRVGSKIIEKINKLNNAIIDLMAIMKL